MLHRNMRKLHNVISIMRRTHSFFINCSHMNDPPIPIGHGHSPVAYILRRIHSAKAGTRAGCHSRTTRKSSMRPGLGIGDSPRR